MNLKRRTSETEILSTEQQINVSFSTYPSTSRTQNVGKAQAPISSSSLFLFHNLRTNIAIKKTDNPLKLCKNMIFAFVLLNNCRISVNLNR